MMDAKDSQTFLYVENESFDKQDVKNNKRKNTIQDTNKNINEESTKNLKTHHNWIIQLPPISNYHKQDYNNINNLKTHEYNMSTIKDNQNYLKNVDIDYRQYKHKTVETQLNKTPISLLNEWAMRGKNKYVVSYLLVAITGNMNKPKFTYVCRVNDIIAEGEGYSKKIAKQNSAANMYQKIVNIKFNSETYDKDIKSTYENITDELHSKFEAVKSSHCDMNPIGALQELSTTYRLPPPLYNLQKLGPLNNIFQQFVGCKTSYKVTCQIFNLQTTGIANTYKEAKRIAARLMYDQVCEIGVEKLNELKILEPKILFHKDYIIENCYATQREMNKFSPLWPSAFNFRLYFSETLNNDRYHIRKQKEQSEVELEKSIIQFNQSLSAIDQLQILSQKLCFHTIYIDIKNLRIQQQKKIDQNKGYAVLLQVTTTPIIIVMGHGATFVMACDMAAQCVLHIFKEMLLFTAAENINLITNENHY